MTRIQVSEIFHSVQGEGRRQGDSCSFVRLYGCGMRCTWCDTMYAVEGGEYEERSLESVLEELDSLGEEYVCVTGGEPLYSRNGRRLVEALVEEGYDVDLETNGAHDFTGLGARVVMDVKTPSSGEESDLSLIGELGPEDDLKFVVRDERDLEYAEEVLNRYPTEAEVFFQQVGGESVSMAEDFLEERGLDGRVQRQLHKLKGVR